jgi:hypothetical protein
MMPPMTYARFLRFLQEDLLISTESIRIAERHVEKSSGSLPMILWQYGLVTIEQLDRIFDWLETSQA